MTPAPAAEAMTWRALALPDLDAIYALHRQAIGAAIRPEVVKPETRDFFAGILEGRGRIEGVFEAGELIAYGVLQHVLPAYDDPRPHIGAPAEAPVAKLAGASVAPEHRGRGLQRALIAARVRLARAGDILFSTSAPGNPQSWKNLLAEGFAIRALVPYYGGHLRYLMVRDGTGVVVEDTRLMSPDDAEGQMALLAGGWRGVAADGASIIYVSGQRVA
ncbi:GNAT family N-acetyltransferase [Xanthobacteraceae bacterium A53D]